MKIVLEQLRNLRLKENHTHFKTIDMRVEGFVEQKEKSEKK